MKMIIRLFSLAVLLYTMPAAIAQEKASENRHKGDSSFTRLSQQLKLTADQQAKLKEAMKQNRAEMKALRESQKAASDERRKALTEQRKKNDERIVAVLTDAQKAEYEKLKAQKKEEVKKKREHHKKRKHDRGSIEELDNELL